MDEVSVPESVTQVFGAGGARAVPAAEGLDAGARIVANLIDLALLNIGPSAKKVDGKPGRKQLDQVFLRFWCLTPPGDFARVTIRG
jgi:hypothetical protein